MKRKKIIKKIDEYLKKYGLSMTKERMTMFDDLLIAIFRLGMKEGEKEQWRKSVVNSIFEKECPVYEWGEGKLNFCKIGKHNWKYSHETTSFNASVISKECTICGKITVEDIKYPEPTNKSGGHKDNPNFCKCDYKCNRKYLDEHNYFCQAVCIKCEYDTR